MNQVNDTKKSTVKAFVLDVKYEESDDILSIKIIATYTPEKVSNILSKVEVLLDVDVDMMLLTDNEIYQLFKHLVRSDPKVSSSKPELE